MAQIILTGTAYSGKSALLNALSKKGYSTFAEAETPLVQKLKDELGPEESKKWILKNYVEFKRMVGERQKEIDTFSVNEKYVFYDRSAICYIGYCKLRNVQPPENLLKLASQTNPKYVFFLEKLTPFKQRKKTGRFMSKSEAGKLANLIEHEYKKRGLNLIRVPEFSLQKEENISKRIKYIEKIIID